MRRLVFTLVFPLTIITFTLFTKWWYVLPTDAPDTMMSGFPFIWISEGWHTSLSLQIFIIELLIDLALYFLVNLMVVYLINRYIVEIILPKLVLAILSLITTVLLIGVILIGTRSENIYKLRRDFEVEVICSGYNFFWQSQKRPTDKDVGK